MVCTELMKLLHKNDYQQLLYRILFIVSIQTPGVATHTFQGSFEPPYLKNYIYIYIYIAPLI